AAFKNFTRPVQAIAEMYRVLKPRGVAVISDLRRDASVQEIDQEIKGMGISAINEMLTRWTFKNTLLKSAYSVQDMKAMVSQTPFGSCRVEVDGIGFQV